MQSAYRSETPAQTVREGDAADGLDSLTAGGMQESEAQRVPLRDEGEAPETISHLTADGGEDVVPHDPTREVDRRNGNAARARKQAAKQSLVREAADGSVHRQTPTTLVIPEEKRCRSLTVRGVRCKVGKMRGMEVCIFHAHRALSDDALSTLANPEAKPRLSPRKALQAVVALRAEELAEAAVEGSLSAEGANRTRAILQLVDAVDPLVVTEEQVSFSPEGAERASWRQLSAAFGV